MKQMDNSKAFQLGLQTLPLNELRLLYSYYKTVESESEELCGFKVSSLIRWVKKELQQRTQ